MATHTTKIYTAAFNHPRNIRRKRKYLTQDAAETLIYKFITTRVGYCNNLLYGVTICNMV